MNGSEMSERGTDRGMKRQTSRVVEERDTESSGADRNGDTADAERLGRDGEKSGRRRFGDERRQRRAEQAREQSEERTWQSTGVAEKGRRMKMQTKSRSKHDLGGRTS